MNSFIYPTIYDHYFISYSLRWGKPTDEKKEKHCPSHHVHIFLSRGWLLPALIFKLFNEITYWNIVLFFNYSLNKFDTWSRTSQTKISCLHIQLKNKENGNNEGSLLAQALGQVALHTAI